MTATFGRDYESGADPRGGLENTRLAVRSREWGQAPPTINTITDLLDPLSLH